MSVKLPEPVEKGLKSVAGLFVAVFGVLNVDLILSAAQATFASAPQIFTGVTLGFLTLPEFIPPTSAGDWVGVVAAALFGLYLAFKVWQNFDEEGLA